MAKFVAVPGVTTINADALDAALKAVSVKCRGIVFDGSLRLVIDDDTDGATETALVAAAQAHNPATLTPEQAALQQGKADADAFKPQIDQTITDLTAARNTFQTTPTLANAQPLLILLTNAAILMLKGFRYILRRL